MTPVTKRMVVEGATDKYANEGERLYICLCLEKFEPLLILYAFEAKFLPLKLCCHAQFNVTHSHLYNLNV